MRSIRLSLLVYFLGLVGVALGVASLLVYRSAQQTLADKEEAMRENIEKTHLDRVREERDRLDRALLEHAKALAGRVRLEANWSQLLHTPLPGPDGLGLPRSLLTLGAITTPAGPYGYVSAMPWLVHAFPGRDFDVVRRLPKSVLTLGVITTPAGPYGYVSAMPWLVHDYTPPHRPEPRPGAPRFSPRQPMPAFVFEIWRSNIFVLKLNRDFETPGGHTGDYFQIDVNHWGKPLRSKSLGNISFPDPEGFGDDKILHWEPDDFELAPGHWTRRVRLKAASARRLPPASSRRPPTEGTAVSPTTEGTAGSPPMPPMPVLPAVPPESQPSRARPRPNEMPATFIVVQVATDLNQFTETLERIGAKRDQDLEELKARTAESLLYLRNRLLGIGLITFAATILGAWWLVWLGLRPLRRMSDAVSKVSPRDFKLPLGDAPLPIELRPIAERLGCSLDLLKRAFAREKQSTADISHELRTPLAAILATTELALRKQRTLDQYREFLADCRLIARQMNQIVERLLTLARLDAGVDRLRAQPVDVAELAEECAAIVRPLAEAQGLRLSVSCPTQSGPADQSVSLTTDPDKLREVLNNLLHNAIQYNRPQGQIELMVGRENGHVQVAVKDTGIGIAVEVRERIFERFYRADPSRNGDGMHAGLGLALVKEYVDLMGGRINVDSVEGQGSTFRVELPCAAQHADQRPTVSA